MDGLAEPSRTDVGGPHAHRHSHPPGSGPQGPSKSYGSIRCIPMHQILPQTRILPEKVKTTAPVRDLWDEISEAGRSEWDRPPRAHPLCRERSWKIRVPWNSWCTIVHLFHH